jgi:O-acetylhomoserine (thiol)-lyase
VSAIAHDAGLPLLVDSTFTTPWLMKPFDHGADLVFHSATKFLCGHGTVVGGVLVDSGRFDWARTRARFPELNQPYAGFHGMVFSEESTDGAFLLRARREGPARLRRLHEPAHRLADPAGHRDPAAAHGAPRGEHAQGRGLPGRAPDGGGVGYPELEGHPSHALAKKLLPRGCGAVFSFDLKGSRKQGQAFIEALKIFSHLANVGDCRSLVIHPASTTHFRMDDARWRQPASRPARSG